MYKSQVILSYFKDKNVSLTRAMEYSEKNIIAGVASKAADKVVIYLSSNNFKLQRNKISSGCKKRIRISC